MQAWVECPRSGNIYMLSAMRDIEAVGGNKYSMYVPPLNTVVVEKLFEV